MEVYFVIVFLFEITMDLIQIAKQQTFLYFNPSPLTIFTLVMVLRSMENLENLKKSGIFVLVRENLENLESQGFLYKKKTKIFFYPQFSIF